MSEFIVREVSEDGEVNDRKMTKAEQGQLLNDAELNLAKFAEMENALQRKSEIYARLGLTSDEVAALLA